MDFPLIDWISKHGFTVEEAVAGNSDFPAGVVQAVISSDPAARSEVFHAGFTASFMSHEMGVLIDESLDPLRQAIARAKGEG